MKELQEEEVCPCGRGKPYGECCKRNGVLWYREGEVFHKRYNALLPEEALNVFEKNQERFCDLFGREPSDNDLINFDTPAHDNSFFREGLTFLRNMGLPEEWKYAYYRTDGLMPTVENEKHLTQYDLDLFEKYCHEYTELMNSDLQNGNINVLLLTSIVNKALESAFDSIFPRLLSGFEYFLNTISVKKGSIVNPPNTLEEYVSFVSLRAVKALKSTLMLGIDCETESIYSIGRNLFECYVYLKNINDNENFFEDEIRPILTSHEYGFEVKEGEINYKKIHISKALEETTRRKTRSLYQLNLGCGPKTDRDLYNYFYRPACQFVHIDAFTARCCFYEEDIYTEFDPSLVATSCVMSMAILVLEQIAKLPLVPSQQSKDLLYLVSQCSNEICECLLMLTMDPEQEEQEFVYLLERLKMINQEDCAQIDD